jgi:hypothetical protein
MSDKQQQIARAQRRANAKQKQKFAKKFAKLKPMSSEQFQDFVKFSKLVQEHCGPRVTVIDQSGVVRRKFQKDIPFGWPSFTKGTQDPVFRMRIANIQISTTATTAYTTVQGITLAALVNQADVTAMWDEYRVLRGELVYVPTWFPPTNTIGTYHTVAVIDYANSAVLGNLDAALVHDTAKKFYMGIFPEQRNCEDPRWPLLFEKLPDQEWIQTTTTNQNFCYWKPYSNLAQQVSTVTGIGYLTGWVDVQFRGQAA